MGADLAAVMLAFALVYRVYAEMVRGGLLERIPPTPAPYVLVALGFGLAALLMFAHLGLYRWRATVLNLWESQALVQGIALAAALLFGALFLLKLTVYSRIVVAGAILVSLTLLMIERRLLSAFFRRLQLSGRMGRRTLIYGTGRMARLLMKKIIESPQLGLAVCGFVDNRVPIGTVVRCRVTQTGRSFGATVLGRPAELERLLFERGVDEVLVATPEASPERLQRIQDICRRTGVRMGIVPDWGDLRPDEFEVHDLSAVPVLRPREMRHRGGYLATKRILDATAASVLLFASAPIWLAAALWVVLDSPGPALFIQERVGLRGKRFRIYKFRTMARNTHPYASSPPDNVDARITRAGRILRVTGIDELPQLVNVVRGDMSLVGPRPEMPFLVERYGPLERRRLEVKPGITGLWQLSADRHAEIHESIEYDLHYLYHQSLVLDLLILLETAFFTAGLLLRFLRRERSRVDELREGWPAVSPAPYVLVALDQRRHGVPPPSWTACLAAALALPNRLPLKVVAGSDNEVLLDAALQAAAECAGEAPRPTEYVSYGSRADLRSLTLGARVLITDLSHVVAWARAAGLDVLVFESGTLRWENGSPDGSATAEALSPTVSPATPDASAGWGSDILASAAPY